MSIPLYDATVMNFIQGVTGASSFLEQGLAHATQAGVDPNDYVEARLTHDMLPLRFQVNQIIHHSAGALAGVKQGVSSPNPGDMSLDYRGLQAALGEALTSLKSVMPDEVEGLIGRDMRFEIGDMKLPFTAEGFLLSFSLPNFYFHAATAYDILRMQGVPLGKRDYLGMPRVKAG